MKNKEKKNIEDFSLSQLHILLEHLRLGVDHLKILLSPSQLKDLFDWCDLKKQHKKQISADKIEKFGNMSLIINTILTSTFGAWMGLSGCIGCQLGSIQALTIISTIAFFVSGLVGYMSLKLTQNQARNAIDNQKIRHFKLKVLKLINQKFNEKIDEISFYLNTSVFILENKKEDSYQEIKSDLNSLKATVRIYEWLERLTTALASRLEEVNDPTSQSLYQKQMNQAIYLIKKTLAKHVQFVQNLAHSKEQEKRRLQMMPALPFLKVLTHHAYRNSNYRSFASSLSKSHFYPLLLGIVPTIWGGFASMFVFVGGIPNIAKELNFLWLTAVLTTPIARLIEITIAGLITCYFAFAFFYSFRKSWQREKLVKDIEKDIADVK